MHPGALGRGREGCRILEGCSLPMRVGDMRPPHHPGSPSILSPCHQHMATKRQTDAHTHTHARTHAYMYTGTHTHTHTPRHIPPGQVTGHNRERVWYPAGPAPIASAFPSISPIPMGYLEGPRRREKEEEGRVGNGPVFQRGFFSPSLTLTHTHLYFWAFFLPAYLPTNFTNE